ncbi:hypothetical protein [Clostridium sp. BL-8]|uniref:hypothetical protein n=1 Tax=Clostridium sp. BL-8 TaxID=349938 RepID=UPI00098C1971|nr:hypothetical protein [Clostridium sp. BL-8]OOM75385.1 hypothetical protein CLOBL_40020 [Clostridium sp. BL-8]
MRKSNLILIFFVVIFLVGISILMDSVNLGDKEVSRIVHDYGGSIDTNTYVIYLEQSITKYRYMGSILSILGGLGAIKNISNGGISE